jgi:membrane-associated phospholipid phosphatase
MANVTERTRGRAPLLFATSIAAAAGFALIARAVARRDTAAVDHEVHDQTAIHPGHPAREVAEAAGPIGKWWTYVPAAVLTGAYVVASREEDDELPSRILGTAAIVGTAAIAAALNQVFDDLLPQPPAPPGRPSPDHPVFPSGHAFGTSSVALAAAYVLAREGCAHPLLAFPTAMVIPMASSVARLVEEKHWISDILGGHLAAIALSTLMLAVYEAGLDCRP